MENSKKTPDLGVWYTPMEKVLKSEHCFKLVLNGYISWEQGEKNDFVFGQIYRMPRALLILWHWEVKMLCNKISTYMIVTQAGWSIWLYCNIDKLSEKQTFLPITWNMRYRRYRIDLFDKLFISPSLLNEQ